MLDLRYRRAYSRAVISPSVMTRRAFLGYAVGSCALLPYSFVGRPAAGVCPCGASIVKPNVLAERGRPVSYCPNCGRDVHARAFALRANGWRASASHDGRGARWNAAQVPFPNPALVQVSSKPRIQMRMVRV